MHVPNFESFCFEPLYKHRAFLSHCSTWGRVPPPSGKFENHLTRNDVIMMSLPKTVVKCGPQWNQTKYTSFEKFWQELSKNVICIEFEPLCQKLWVFMSSFTMTTHQIWSCQVTLALQISKIFIFSLILHWILGKSPNLGEIGSRTNYRQKAKQGVENTPPPPPVPRVKVKLIFLSFRIFTTISF